mgnify:CR=1 FL=1
MLVIATSLSIAVLWRSDEGRLSWVLRGGIPFVAVATLLLVAWAVSLHTAGAYDTRFAGTGATEYTAVAKATLGTFSALAILSYALKLEIARGFVLLALPLGLAALVVAHWLWRRWLCRRRAAGQLLHRVLVVGDHQALTHLIATLDRSPEAGYSVVGACCSDNGLAIGRVPVVGHELDAADIARQLRVDAVACASSATLGASAVRALSWRLEGSDVQMIVVPSLADVAGPRVSTRPINGIPLLLVEQPRFEGFPLVMKTLIDRLLSLAGIVAVAPVLLAITVAIKLDDGGPALFRQERVGINGKRFTMLKFRSMCVGADRMQDQLRAEHAQENAARGPLFKMKNDPRVTRVGKFIRRTSLDELPQLWNIVRGDMSLVGPRPPLPREVITYDSVVTRRLLVKPGLTGMWQINGRSDLSWQESVRLDLYYVENWSPLGDLMIIVRTLRVVMHHEGAY